MDFAENFAFAYQNEVQSLHWIPHSCTLFVMVSYRWSDAQPGNVGNDVDDSDIQQHLIKEQHFFISEDNKHDQPFVDHCTRHYLSSTFQQPSSSNTASASDGVQQSNLEVSPAKIIIWTDGCAAQFKSANAFADNAKLARDWECPLLLLWTWQGRA